MHPHNNAPIKGIGGIGRTTRTRRSAAARLYPRDDVLSNTSAITPGDIRATQPLGKMDLRISYGNMDTTIKILRMC